MSNDSATRSLSAWFVTATRLSGESFVKLDDGAPEWLADAVRDAHEDEFPNDWRYETCRDIVSNIVDGVMESGEIAESVADIWNSSLAAWLGDNVGRSADVDEWMTDYGWSAPEGIWSAIRGGQWLCIDRMACVMLAAVQAAHEAYCDECEDENLDAHSLAMWLVHGMPSGPLG